VFNIFEQVVRPTRGASRATWRDALGYLRNVAGTMTEITGSCDGTHDAQSLRSSPKRPRATPKVGSETGIVDGNGRWCSLTPNSVGRLRMRLSA
jgi:hypothetical protein